MVEDILAQIQVNGLVREATRHVEYLSEQERDPNFLVFAIRYLTHSHAMPPLEGNIEWFRSALDVLVELACPNTPIGPEHE